MVVLILERVTPSLRGEITRWLIELKAGVFVGKISSRVRALLWARIEKNLQNSRNVGSAILLRPDNTEQGFTIDTLGDPTRLIEDFEGLYLPKKRVSE